ncbi:MAG: zinc ribbon domain-containing protein [Planctomycetes bacterium]|nr:zinc ribbon domain-containing protein [Planctomycetota bacterium]
MPLFEYECRGCNRQFEALVSARVTEPVHCPFCESAKVERLIGLPTAKVVEGQPATNCRGDAPPCGAPWCGRKG